MDGHRQDDAHQDNKASKGKNGAVELVKIGFGEVLSPKDATVGGVPSVLKAHVTESEIPANALELASTTALEPIRM